MAGEIGRFTALIGADGSGLTRGLRGAARDIELFVQDTQRRVSRLTEGAQFSGTRAQSIEALRKVELNLQRALKSTEPTLLQRIALEKELAKTSAAIQGSTGGVLSALLGSSKGAAGLNSSLALMGRLFPAIGAAAAAQQLLSFAGRTIDAADAMKDFAERSGASVGVLSVLGRVAEKSGASQESLSVGLRNLAKNVANLRSGSKDAAASFASIGLSARDLAGLSIDQVLVKVADAQARFDDGSEKTALALALFGRSGEELIPTLNALSGGGFARATERAKLLGGVIGDDLVNAADQFNEAMTDFNTVVTGAGHSVLTQLLPPITSFINALFEARRRSLELNDAIPKPFKTANEALLRSTTAGPFFAVVFGSEQEESRRAKSFGETMKQAGLHLLGLKSAAEQAAERIEAVKASFVRLGPPRPTIAPPVSRDDEIRQLRDLHSAFALNASDLKRAKELEIQLRKELDAGTLTREQRAKAQSDLQALKEVQTPKTDTKPIEELLGKVRALVVAYNLAADESGRQEEIGKRLVASYSALARALAAQKDQASAISNELRQQLATLKEMDVVIVGQARKKFGAVDKLPTLEIPAIADVVGVRLSGPDLKRKLAQTARDAQLAFRQLPPIPVEIDPTFDPSNISLEFKNALNAARLAKADLSLAEAVGDQKAFKKATDASVEAQKRLKAVASDLAKIIRNNPDLSNAAKAFGLEAIDAQVQSAATHTSTLGDKLQAIAQHGRGVLSAASAVGLLGDEARLALTSVNDLVESVGELSNAIKSGAKGDIFSAVIQAVSAATNIARSLTGNADQVDKRNKEIIKENTEAIRRLAQDLSGFAQTPGQLLKASKAISDNALLNARKVTDGFSRGFKSVEELERQLRASGTSLSELKRRAEELGISIVDAKGRITAQGLNDLDIALRLFAERMVRFTNSFADQSDAAALRRRVLGQQNDQDKILTDSFDLFKKFAPGLYDKFFQGIDTSTKEGREQFRTAIKSFVEAFIAGIIPRADFGELDKTTLISIVNAWLDSMDAMSEAAQKVVGSMINVAEGGFNLNKRLSQVLSGSQVSPFRDIIPPPPNPTPIPIPVGGDGNRSVGITIDVGGLTIAPNVPATGAARYNEIRRLALNNAKTIGPDAVAAVQQALPPL